ncbi:Zinc transporter ZupT [uncultured archaeon]|nr:Zinc transporter ZupT [uncultured archaeon]
MAFSELLGLGALAGFTIYLGLPLARIRSASEKLKGLLNAAAVGILLFLLVDIMGDAMETVGEKTLQAAGGISSGAQAGLGGWSAVIFYPFILLIGLALGLLGLVWFEKRYIFGQVPKKAVMSALAENAPAHALPEDKARRIALMIAIGIGLHNFSEGLAIGQSWAGGAMSLALLLVVGFGLHNATEGFGIAAPLSGTRPGWKFLAILGLIGGGPTFVGAIVGSFWVSEALSVFFLALAGGAIVYVVKELLYHGRTHGEGLQAMGFLVLGFFVGFASDLLIKFAAGG